jgi:hypothetical protein
MDSTCKKAFLIVVGLPAVLVLTAAWIFVGGEEVNGNLFYGLLDGLSIMWLPTILFLIAGGLVDKILFDRSLLNCFKKKSYKDKFI